MSDSRSEKCLDMLKEKIKFSFDNVFVVKAFCKHCVTTSDTFHIVAFSVDN